MDGRASRKWPVSYTHLDVYKRQHVHEPVSFEGIRGRIADLQVEIEGRGFGTFTISVAADEKRHTDIVYDCLLYTSQRHPSDPGQSGCEEAE